MLKRRLSVVDQLNVLSLAYSSVLEVGDSYMILPTSRALAVQREYQFFLGQEGHFHHSIFNQTIPRPVITEHVSIRKINESPQIHVQSVFVTGASFSSIIHIGSTTLIQGEARVKHIRQLKDDADDEDNDNEK